MTWKSFQASAFRLTEQDVQDLAPLIAKQYQEAIKAINEELKEAYAKVLTGINKADYYSAMVKYDRLTKLLDEVSRQYASFSRKAGRLIGQAGEISMSNNFYRLQFSHKWLTPRVSFSVLPNELVQMSVYGSIEAYKKYQSALLSKVFGPGGGYMPQYGTLSQLLATNRTKELANIQAAITQGLLRGQSYTKTAASIKDIIGQFIKKDGEIHTTGAMANAQRIVRTESARIMNEASIANTEYARSEGVEVVRYWDATLDSATRPKHGQLDDTPENKDGMFESSSGPVRAPGAWPSVKDNANERCTTWESVNGSKPTLRRGRNPETGENEVFAYTDFNTWAKDNNLTKNKYGQIIPEK